MNKNMSIDMNADGSTYKYKQKLTHIYSINGNLSANVNITISAYKRRKADNKKSLDIHIDIHTYIHTYTCEKMYMTNCSCT